MRQILTGLLGTVLMLNSGLVPATAQGSQITPPRPQPVGQPASQPAIQTAPSLTPPTSSPNPPSSAIVAQPGVPFCQLEPSQSAALAQARTQAIAWLRADHANFKVDELPKLLQQRNDAARAYTDALNQVQAQLKANCFERSPLQKRGMWLRAYACDGQSLAALEVIDRLLVLGITDVYLESFYTGRTLYPSGSFASHCSQDQGNLLRLYTQLAHARGIRLHAWIRATDFGPDYSSRYPERRLRNGFGQIANLRNSLGDGNASFQASALYPGTRSTEDFHWFVDPTHPAVQKDLQQVVREVAEQGVDGVMLDYIRYPVVSCTQSPEIQQGCLNRDPRLFWLFSEQGFARFLSYLRRQRPDVSPAQIDAWLNPRARRNQPFDPALAQELEALAVTYMRDSVTELVRQSAGTLRSFRRRSIQLSAAVWPDGNRDNPVDPRLQAYQTFPLSSGGLSPMLYAYNLTCPTTPAATSTTATGSEASKCVLAEFDRVLSARPKADFCANLAADPPYARANGPRHAPLEQQAPALLSYARSRDLNLTCVNYFAYGWLFPQHDQQRKAACETGLPARPKQN
ncbi:hypothetical protein [Leptolyngbya sp. FACHB-261]|uniref:hypothetical protein n=1 Tax=Leptolyngbya sp. FACHB-261 TaxID=2692806 RepID=UPI00168806C7|nr:hypothetical protein [Leptolyngbya sp. FACHB-261]MBD2104813.1 hypothetical protein [Leptolyngbya sp. FACHB-261]